MLIRIDPGASTPLGEQIAASVRRAIAEQTVRPGEQLPSARTLAASLGVNMHTVLRAYAALREEGLIDLRRGRGAVVVSGGGGAADRAALAEAVHSLTSHARRLGLGREEVLTLVREAYP